MTESPKEPFDAAFKTAAAITANTRGERESSHAVVLQKNPIIGAASANGWASVQQTPSDFTGGYFSLDESGDKRKSQV